jgi:Yip1 domain
MSLREGRPYLAAICVAPRQTMRAILDRPDRRGALAIVIAAIVSFSLRDLDVEGLAEAGASLGVPTAMLISILAIAGVVLVAMLFYFVVSAAAALVGRWMLGGTGSFRDVRHAVAWGLAPQVWALFFRLPALLLWPDAVATLRGGRGKIQLGDLEITPFFSPDVPIYQVVLIGLVELGFFIWYLIVGSQTLGEAQRFSSMRGFGNLLLAVVLPFVALIVIVVAIFLAAWTV